MEHREPKVKKVACSSCDWAVAYAQRCKKRKTTNPYSRTCASHSGGETNANSNPATRKGGAFSRSFRCIRRG